jgi:hypothetical protein
MPTTTATQESLTGDMVAVGKDSKVKPLGFITWFSIPDKPVNLKVLKKHWLMAGLDPKVLPPDPRALFLFKRAVRGQEGRVRHADGSITETDVVRIIENADFCIYQITRVVRDEDRREVDYPKAMRVTYNKRAGEIEFNKLGETKRVDLRPMMEEIQDFVEQNTKTVNGRKVRTMVRDFLKDGNDERSGKVGLSGENMRGKAGGVYFVGARYKEELDGLAVALEGLYADDGQTYGLYTVPLADGKSEREMIRAHHVANTVKETQEAMTFVAKLLREDRTSTVRVDVSAHWYRKLQALKRRNAEYNALLKDEQEEVNDITSMLERQLSKLPSG